MAEYIERDAVHDLVRSLTKYAWTSPNNTGHRVTVDADDVNFGVDKIPAADVSPVRHGRWLHTEEPLGWEYVDCMECSACHDSWIIEEDYCFDDMPLWNYCPSCGAKMDGGED